MKVNLSKHAAIIGETQCGKTLLANYLFKRTHGLYFDIEDLGDIDSEITFNINSSVNRLKVALQENRKVQYTPSPKQKLFRKEIAVLWDILSNLNRNTYIYVDEIQTYGSSHQNAFDVLALRGLKHGVHLVSVTQRPAYLSKHIATQTTTYIFFNVSDFESIYFSNYGLPFDEIKEKLSTAPKYSFVVYEKGYGVSEPYKIKI